MTKMEHVDECGMLGTKEVKESESGKSDIR